MDSTIAIIGAGPAGSMLAFELASSDKEVLLYDHKAPWEKPCGGSLRPDIIDEHPELKESVNWCSNIEYISPKNARTHVRPPRKIPVIPRKQLNKFFLEIARRSGAKFIQRKVLNISRYNSQWIIVTDDSSNKVDLLVGADGVSSIVRKATVGRFPKEQLGLTCGYILTGVPKTQYVIHFLDIEGYIWVFSRPDHTSAGIGAKLATVSVKDLFKRLDTFLRKNYKSFEIKKKYSALIPIASGESFFDSPRCGKNWLLIGDAAGYVDPLVGEGIYYALESAKLAGQAILRKDIQSYDQLWRHKYGVVFKQRTSFRMNLAKLSKAFSPEVFGIMMYDQAIGGFFSQKRV